MSKHHYEYNKANSHGEAEISYRCACGSRAGDWIVFVNERHNGIKFHYDKCGFKCFKDAENWLMSLGRKGTWHKIA